MRRLMLMAYATQAIGLGARAARAQEADADVVGRVVDGQRGALVGAAVTVRSAGGPWRARAMTDGAGRFQIPAPAAGPLVVDVDAQGFERVSRPVTAPEMGDILVGRQCHLHYLRRDGRCSRG
jgi:hypothetical protein